MIGRSKGTSRFIPSLVLGQEAATTARKSTCMSALLYESKDSKHFCFPPARPAKYFCPLQVPERGMGTLGTVVDAL